MTLKSKLLIYLNFVFINPFASLRTGASAIKYEDANIVTPSTGEVKGLIVY